MMPRRKEPVDLILAKGKSHHITKEIEEQRRAGELKVPFKKIEPPPMLRTKKRKEEFIEIAEMLDAIGIWTELDATVLAMFVIARSEYAKFTALLEKEMAAKEIGWKAIEHTQISQNAAFKQVMTCASRLGLTITDRCKIVMPQAPEQPKENKFAKLLKGEFDA
ncbi:phage terminase small subunit P27 family [uncultured Dubosiella sp.]|uniref:phage terminase small subunit P27 family n=2 Tax=uncultured Dubosiella sp. TaxID=1937011 RepID=UPI00272E08C1|nr:phage terminase small subunit P27 family [uncultured Dubosiella sp.]